MSQPPRPLAPTRPCPMPSHPVATGRASPAEAHRDRFPARLTRAVGAAAIPALFFGTAAHGQIDVQPYADATPSGLSAVEGGSNGDWDEIIVTGRYLANDKFGAGKVPVPVIDVPQSLTITTEEQIEEQAFRDFGDVLRFTPGAAIAQGEGHRDQITLRGQNTTADFFVDGIRDDVQYFRPFYNLEQVEILRGANALIFGRGGGGGAINRVTKTPDMAADFGDLTLSADTFGSAFAALDLNHAASASAGLRLNAFVETLDNHRDAFGGERFALNPTFALDLTPDTRLDLSYEYVDDDRVVDRGVPSLDGEPVEGFTDTFFGSPDLNTTELRAHILRARVDHDLGEGFSANATLQYANYDKLYQNLYPIGIDPAAGEVSLDGYRDATVRDNLIAQANLVAEFATGALDHTLLVGAEYGDQDTQNARRDALFADSQDDQITFALPRLLAFDIPEVAFPAFSRNRASDVEFASLYIQDQIALGPVQIIGGVRYDDFSIKVDDLVNARQLGSDDDRFSPRLGLIYKPKDDISLYASWSESFLPRAGDQFLTLTPTTAALAPEQFENLEAGVKWDFLPSFGATLSVFELQREAGSVVDPSDPGSSILVGARTRGFEAEVSGRLLDIWTLHAGYSYLDADERGRVVGGALANRTLPSVPAHMAFVWSRYDLTDRFGLAAGLTYQSEQFASIGNTVELPDFLRVDAAAYFELTDRVELQLNIENLFDTEYYPAAHNDNNISTGEPLNARLTLRTAF